MTVSKAFGGGIVRRVTSPAGGVKPPQAGIPKPTVQKPKLRTPVMAPKTTTSPVSPSMPVRKSYLGKGQFVAATKLPKDVLRHSSKNQKNILDKDRFEAKVTRYRAHREERQSILGAQTLRDAGTKKKTVGNVTTMNMPGGALTGMLGGTIKTGGRKGPSTVFVSTPAPKKVRESILNHEMAHASPKRSGYRLRQIMDDPAKLGREEARAEMAGGVYYKGKRNNGVAGDMFQSSYVNAARRNKPLKPNAASQARGYQTGGREFTDAFRQTQDKIAAAQGTPKSFVNRLRDKRK